VAQSLAVGNSGSTWPPSNRVATSPTRKIEPVENFNDRMLVCGK
jgi:hypothetical protein